MSSVDINATFGLRYRWISFAGVGAGANIIVSDSCRTYPVFAVFRTDFSGSVRFLFLDLRGGAALNYFQSDVRQTDAYGAVSIGFVLFTGNTFCSYITAGGIYLCGAPRYHRRRPYGSLSTAVDGVYTSGYIFLNCKVWEGGILSVKKCFLILLLWQRGV